MATTEHQQWNPEQYEKNARFVSDLGMPVVTLLEPRAGERILDVGCGDGPLTKKLVEMGCEVVAVDASPAMIEAAKALGLDARVMDGQALQFAREFDAVFSNAALHWMKQPEAVINGVWQALKPGGRFVAEFGGDGNTATVLRALDTRVTTARPRLSHVESVVLSVRGRVSQQTRNTRIRSQHHRADSKTNTIAGESRRLAGDLRAKLCRAIACCRTCAVPC